MAAKPRWKPDLRFVLDFYDAWLREGNLAKVAAALEMSGPGLANRIERWTELQEAQELATERRKGRRSLAEYVYQRLSPEGRKVWDEIQFWNDTTSAYEQVEKILSGKTVQLRQELFIHALVTSNFDLSSACRIVGVSRATLDNWRREPEFRQLVEEIQWHKKNFFERALIDLVEERHPGATIFVNRTVNADRGYADKLEVEHTGEMPTLGVTVTDLDLPLDVRKELLHAIRNRKPPIDIAPKALPAPANGK